MKKLIYILLLTVVILTGCNITIKSNGEKFTFKELFFRKNTQNKIRFEEIPIKNIVYKNKDEHEDNYTVYIKEKDNFEPYMVIDDDYSDNSSVLLIRKYLIDEEISYNDVKHQGSNGRYYPKSNIDNYLNSDFLSRFSEKVKNKILDTSIEVAKLEAVRDGNGELKSENIIRKIFILSATEMGIKSGNATIEGRKIDFFKDEKNYLATNKLGEGGNYFLRSPCHWDDIQAFIISNEGNYGCGNVSAKLSIRPAFCMGKDTIVKGENIDNKMVYVLVD